MGDFRQVSWYPRMPERPGPYSAIIESADTSPKSPKSPCPLTFQNATDLARFLHYATVNISGTMYPTILPDFLNPRNEAERMKTKMPRNYVRTQRRRWAFTQEEVADLLGFESRTCISRIEQGKRVPTLESALALEVLFGEPPKSLFPHVYAEAEEALMQRAAILHEGLINSTSPREKRKCELLECALKRAIHSSTHPQGV